MAFRIVSEIRYFRILLCTWCNACGIFAAADNLIIIESIIIKLVITVVIAINVSQHHQLRAAGRDGLKIFF